MLNIKNKRLMIIIGVSAILGVIALNFMRLNSSQVAKLSISSIQPFQKLHTVRPKEQKVIQNQNIENKPHAEMKRPEANQATKNSNVDVNASLDSLKEAINRGKSIMKLQEEKDETSLKLDIANLEKQLASVRATTEVIKKNPEIFASKELGAKEVSSTNTKINMPVDMKGISKQPGLPLNAISGDKAVISGKVYKKGDFVEGYKITSVGKNSIEVERDGKTHIIDLL